jgi:HEAT repeat protein
MCMNKSAYPIGLTLPVPCFPEYFSPATRFATEGSDMSRKRKWMVRLGLGLGLVAIAAGTWAGLNATTLQAMYAAHQLRAAAGDAERADAADRLLTLGEAGRSRLIEFLRSGDEPTRAAAAAAIDRLFNSLSDGEQLAVSVGGQVIDTFFSSDAAGQRLVLELLPGILKRTGSTHALRCRDAVAIGLQLPDPTARLAAIRLSMHPDVRLQAELLPLLQAPEPEVRQAALIAAATVIDGEPILTDEELFRWLHDPDAGVRRVCYDTLVSRDRSEAEIGLGRRLTHPDARERLKLLMDLRYDDDVADPEPWLERLSRDPDPAVRAGAVRVAVELAQNQRQPCPGWVARVVMSDPSPTVRRVAAYFHNQSVRLTSDGVRPAGGR